MGELRLFAFPYLSFPQPSPAMSKTSKAKTTENTNSVNAFLETVTDEAKRADAYALMTVIQDVTKFEPRMWGTAIVGFGSYHYRYESGHEGDAPLVGFSPRKQNFALYLSPDFENRDALLTTLGKHKTGKGCVYINRMEDVSLPVLKKLIKESVVYMQKKYPE